MTNQDGSIFTIRYKTIEDEQADEITITPSNNNINIDKQTQTQAVQDNENSQKRVAGFGNLNADKDVINSFLNGETCLSGVIIELINV